MNVYDAAKQRIEYIFSKFDNVYIAFSGGKDSGTLVNLVYDFLRSPAGAGKKCTTLFIDLEGHYKRTHDFSWKLMMDNAHLATPMWICLPMRSWNTVSMHETWWKFWDPEKKDKWVRPMPESEYVINSDNNPFGRFWHEGITFEDFITEFGDWFAKENGGKCAGLVGIRTQESLNRWRALNRDDVSRFENVKYSVVKTDLTVNFYPIYDWTVEDIWTYHAKTAAPYNETYDQFYKAGVALGKMRICEPFGDEQKAGLNMFRIIEPETWGRLLDRVSGVNFGNIYCGTKAIGSADMTLPAGHTWKSYCKFLMKTLPTATRDNYMSRFVKYIKYWHYTGSPMLPQHIKEIPAGAAVNTEKFSKRGRGEKHVVKFNKILDDLPAIYTKCDVPTWKKFCSVILANDITCKRLGFAITKHQRDLRKEALKKYARKKEISK